MKARLRKRKDGGKKVWNAFGIPEVERKSENGQGNI